MSGTPGSNLSACGCCEPSGTLIEPVNRPGLSALSYRIGTYATFFSDMLARIHSSVIPDGTNQGAHPLAALTTRVASDPALALIDAWAIVADVLTFYQERIANEGYLRSATERLSVLELARTIGYELNPGVAASAFLAFTVDDTRGAPAVVTVPRGAKVQNVPPQGKLPQTFETVESIQAVVSRNSLQPRRGRPQDLALVSIPDPKNPGENTFELFMLGINSSFPAGSFQTFRASQVYPLNGLGIPDPVAAVPIRNQVFFKGTNANLQKGDRLLMVGRNDNNKSSVQTKVVIVRDVAVQASLNQTRVDLRDDLAESPQPPQFIRPAPPFAPRFSETSVLNLAGVSAVIGGTISESNFSAYAAMNNWNLIDIVSIAGVVRLYPPAPEPPLPNASAKLPPPDPGIFALRTHVGFFGNNAPAYKSLLAPANQGFNGFLYPNDWDKSGWQIWNDPNSDPKLGSPLRYLDAQVFLEQVVPGILRDSWIVLESPTGRVVYRVGTVIEAALAGFGLSGRATGLRLTELDGTSEVKDADKDKLGLLVRNTIAYAQSESLDLAGLPVEDDIPAGTTELMLDGLVLGLQPGQPVALSGSRTASDAPGVVSNEVLILQDITHVAAFTTLGFSSGLQYGYVRGSVTLNANVARATHGETVNEVLGSGDASQANQSFTLKRPPLTYVPASTPTGSQSTLEVRINDLLWQEAASLSGLGPRDQDYIVRLEDGGTTTVIFGDGGSGALLPSGQQNVMAKYRSGIGPDGNVDAGSLGLFQTRPPGIRAVTNPVAASGAAAREDLDHARQNAPLKVLTLDRIVSLDDYENFARTFAGIGKAQAQAIWSGEKRLVHLTVAGANGEAVDPTSVLFTSLVGSITQAHDPVQQVLVASYQPLFFDVEASVLVDQLRYVAADVLAAIAAALRDAFSFDRRSFAQPATAAEVTTIIQSVPGVIASDLNRLFPVTVRQGLLPVLCASPARLENGRILPAELLLVNPAGITLTETQP